MPIDRTRDHGCIKSVYSQEQEGKQIEIYCEVPELLWQKITTIFKAGSLDLEAS
jgi:hypothetical protein